MCAGTHALNSYQIDHVVYEVRFGVPTSDTAEPYRHASSAVDDCRLLLGRITEVTRRPGLSLGVPWLLSVRVCRNKINAQLVLHIMPIA